MTDETGSPAGQESIALPADAPETFDSPSAAADYFNALRSAKPEKEDKAESAEAPEPATAENELPGEGDTASPETDSGEGEETVPETPAIEPPNSWTKAEKERFATLPRETQEYLHTRELERERAFSRSQNEIAEQRKAVQAEREAAEKVRQQYEASLPALMKELESVNQASFSDIKTMEDVVKLQAEDPFRFQSWQVHQMRLQAAKQESDRLQNEQNQTKQAKRASYEAEQNQRLVELVPEMADSKKAAELRERAISLLTDDLGLKNDQLTRWYADDTGHEILAHAGIQKLMADGLKFRDLLNAPKAVASKPLPPVQKPGTSKPSGTANSERIQALTRQLNETGDLKYAQELRQLQMRR